MKKIEIKIHSTFDVVYLLKELLPFEKKML